jgi:hypothetical protein
MAASLVLRYVPHELHVAMKSRRYWDPHVFFTWAWPIAAFVMISLIIAMNATALMREPAALGILVSCLLIPVAALLLGRRLDRKYGYCTIVIEDDGRVEFENSTGVYAFSPAELGQRLFRRGRGWTLRGYESKIYISPTHFGARRLLAIARPAV